MANLQVQSLGDGSDPKSLATKEHKEHKEDPYGIHCFAIYAFFAVKLLVHPVTLGTGAKLFADGKIPAAFRLVECTATPSGVIAAHYQRAGEIKTGMMGG